MAARSNQASLKLDIQNAHFICSATELKKIESEAYKTIQSIRGEADAKATQIYADAYNRSPDAAGFYEFLKTMETYEQVLGDDTTVVLSTESDLFRFLKRMPSAEELSAGRDAQRSAGRLVPSTRVPQLSTE